MREWFLAGALLLVAALLAACTEPAGPVRTDVDGRGAGEADAATEIASTPVAAGYVGTEVCADCHGVEAAAWRGSHHQRAMEHPSAASVEAPFEGERFTFDGVESVFEQRGGTWQVTTEGPGGVVGTFPVRYTFGVEPLQQYLLELPDGRLQALSASWDTRDGHAGWFRQYADLHVPADDVLHWTAPSQSWNGVCADCHSTALRKRYDPALDRYETTYEEVSVGCEACHGPGSLHVEEARAGAVVTPLPDLAAQAGQIESCAPCHSRREQLAEGFAPPGAYLDHYLPALLDTDLYHSDGQILDEVYVWGSFRQSRMHEAGVRCTHCHDPHGAEVRLPGNGVCTQCHAETGRADFPTLRPAAYDDVSHHFHEPGSEGAQCVSCHMTARTYMGVDARRDHSFRIPRPDLADLTGAPDACTGCHADQSPAWAAAEIEARFGGDRREHFGAALARGRRGEADAEQALAALARDADTPVLVRASALSLLAGYARGWSREALLEALASDEPLLRIGAARGAQRFAADERWRRLAPLLDDPLRAVRTEAVRALLPVAGELPSQARGRWTAALRDHRAQLDYAADGAAGQTSIANVELALGDSAAAEAAFERALEINPSWVPALVNLSDLLRATGRDGRAGPLFERAEALAPDSPDVLAGHALWLVRQQRTPEALPKLMRARDVAPDDQRATYLLAIALNSGGEPIQALDVIDSYLALRPGDEQMATLAFGIARDAGLLIRARRYERGLRGSG